MIPVSLTKLECKFIFVYELFTKYVVINSGASYKLNLKLTILGQYQKNVITVVTLPNKADVTLQNVT